MARVEPYSDRFHLDVADGHYVPEMLFFPALVGALRPHSSLPFEVHLMTTDPARWVGPFCDAGADVIIFTFDSTGEPEGLLDQIHGAGKQAGISLSLPEPIGLLDGLWEKLDIVTIIGTEIGIKGAELDSSVPAKITSARAVIAERGASTLIQADGGIRRHSVPLLRAAGADFIVPGSLMFSDDPAAVRSWLDSL